MNATEIAAALSARAEDVCRRYLPRGRKQGRYWTIGDTSGAKGRSLFVRLAPPGIPGKWTEYVAVLIMLLWLVPDPSGLAGVLCTVRSGKFAEPRAGACPGAGRSVILVFHDCNQTSMENRHAERSG